MLGTKQILTIGEVAQLHEIPEKSVRTAIKRGELLAIRYNAKVIRILRSAVVDWYTRCQSRESPSRLVKAQPGATHGAKGAKGHK